MSNGPLAYHITFGTYGTRLHGDPRGTVDRTLNNPGDPIIGADGGWQRIERSRLNFPPVVLSDELRRFADSIVPDLCEQGGWTFHACASRPDHVHVLLSTDREGKAVRSWLKRWLGEALCKRWPLPDGAGWWAKGGSVKWVWQDRYFHNVRKYILCQRRANEERVEQSRLVSRRSATPGRGFTTGRAWALRGGEDSALRYRGAF